MMRGTTPEGFISQGHPAPGHLGQKCFILRTVTPWFYCLLVTELHITRGPRDPPQGDVPPEIQPPTPTVQLSIPILPPQSL